MKHWILPTLLTALVMPNISNAENMTYDATAQANKMLKRMDTNQNGSVSKEEFFRPSNFRFNRFDTDKNKVLTRDEMLNYWKNKRKSSTDNPNAWNGPTNSHFVRFDKNQDEQISLDEYQRKSKLSFKALDADANNIISKQEVTNHWLRRKKELDEHNEAEEDD